MQSAALSEKYDRAAPVWNDKIRLLGYYDAYLGFLASQTLRANAGHRVIDVGCGTGAFADAWAAIHGPDQRISLLDMSEKMLKHAASQLERRGIVPTLISKALQDHSSVDGVDTVLAAHVIEHVQQPENALRDMRALCRTGGHLWLIVSKPHWCNAIIWFQWRHRAYDPARVKKMLAESGWDLVTDYAFPSGPASRTSRGYFARAV